MADQHPAADIFPPARIRILTPRLELRVPSERELVELCEVAARGVHEPSEMPFAEPWSDAPADEIPRNAYQWHLAARGSFAPTSWTLLFAAYVDGRPVGAQDIAAREFGIRREVGSGSWLSKELQGRGLGTEMREAVLHLAFAGLEAEWAVSGAYHDNAASNRVSEKCGYVPDGSRVHARRRGPQAPGGPSCERVLETRYRIDRATWEQRRRDDIELHGIDDDVRALVGLTDPVT